MESSHEFTQQLQRALQANHKNVKDLIGQEISLWLLTEHLKANPEQEAQIPELFGQIYRRISYTIKDLFYDLLEQQGLTVEQQALETAIELFVHELVQEQEKNLYERLSK